VPLTDRGQTTAERENSQVGKQEHVMGNTRLLGDLCRPFWVDIRLCEQALVDPER